VSDFEKAVLALTPGQVSEPVLTSFGYHIIKLESKQGDKFHARHILIPIQLAGAHLDEVDAKTDTLERRGADQSDPTALDSAAALIGAKVNQAPPLRQGDRAQSGLGPVPDAGIWAFEARPGETSGVIETREASYVFRLDSLQPGGIAPLDQIRDVVRRIVMSQKKREAARQLAETLAADIARRRMPLDSAAKRRSARLVTIGPFTRAQPTPMFSQEAAAVGAAFGAPVGQVSDPVVGERAIYLVQPVARRLADSTAFTKQLATQREQALQTARQNRVRLVLSSLRAGAKVEDRRKELEQANRAAEELQQGLQKTRGSARGPQP
jgi:peptidyl-prolyl cis-trans isomerase D